MTTVPPLVVHRTCLLISIPPKVLTLGLSEKVTGINYINVHVNIDLLFVCCSWHTDNF